MNISEMIEQIMKIQEQAELLQTNNGFDVMTTCGRALSALEELDSRIKKCNAVERARFEKATPYKLL